MKHAATGLLLLFLDAPTVSAEPPKHFEHVVIIVLENEDNAVVLKNPVMKALAKGGRRFASYDGVAHPSYPNYLALVAGNSFHIQNDHQQTLDARTIADLLEASHLTWTQYAENYSGNCFLGDQSSDPAKLYRRKNVPFLSFKSIQAPARCVNVVAADTLDWHHLPNYAFFTPNMRDDGHDTSLAFAAMWLKGFLDKPLKDPSVMKDTLIVVTFDESATQSNNHIYTVFLGGMVKPGVDSKHYDHYSLLRTIEDNFGVGNLVGAKDAAATLISDAWNTVP